MRSDLVGVKVGQRAGAVSCRAERGVRLGGTPPDRPHRLQSWRQTPHGGQAEPLVPLPQPQLAVQKAQLARRRTGADNAAGDMGGAECFEKGGRSSRNTCGVLKADDDNNRVIS